MPKSKPSRRKWFNSARNTSEVPRPSFQAIAGASDQEP
jgi:hypothetical protein